MLPYEIIEYDRLQASCDCECPYDPCLEGKCDIYRRLEEIREEWSHVMIFEEGE